jgi:NAD(P)H-quinone oxidoreductase subunit 5
MSGLLIAVPALPLIVALVIGMARPAPRTASRATVAASGLAALGAIVVLIVVAVDGPADAVITDGDGVAVAGLAVDRVGAILLLLTSGVGLVVQSFAARSLLGDPRAIRFHVAAAVLASAASLVAITATASGLLVAWIVTSVALAVLIGLKAPWWPAVSAQRLAVRSFVLGDLALLAAVVVSVVAVGDIDMRSVGRSAAELDAESIGSVSVVSVVAVLLVIAGVARSALVPIHRWLPATLAAPTPVSALLHAGVINGAGVLLIRFSPVFGSSSAAMAIAFALGIVTALIATAVMLVRTDVKGGLVWSTSGQMGFMVVQLGVGAFAAALFHIVGHALYKAAMFLGAGGAISAHARQGQRPHLGARDTAVLSAPATRLIVGLLLPVAAFVLALALIDPHLTVAATILIVVFGALSVGRAANGWMSSTPFGAARTIATAVGGVVIATFAYVGGLTVFETFIGDEVPYDVPAAVGPVWVAAVLAVIAGGILAVVFAPGERGDTVRRSVYAWLLSTGTQVRRPVPEPAVPRRPSHRPAATTPAPTEFATAGDLA